MPKQDIVDIDAFVEQETRYHEEQATKEDKGDKGDSSSSSSSSSKEEKEA